MESNQKASGGDGVLGTQKEAALRLLTQRTGYQLKQVRNSLHLPGERSSAALVPGMCPGLKFSVFCSRVEFSPRVFKPFPAVFQENGQRRYGGPPPAWDGPPPERGSEIFVGKLPRDLFEDELVPLCEKVRGRWLMWEFQPRFYNFLISLFVSPVW